MSDDTKPDEQSEQKFSQERYDLLTIGQTPWWRWLVDHPQGTWQEFTGLEPDAAAVISRALEEWEDSRPNGAHLERAYLERAHLKGAYLREAHLEGALIGEAHLEGAELFGAHLEGAHLRRAHLEGAYLQEAHLEGAYLQGAHLEGAHLRPAHLEGADLSDAHLEGAYLGGAHLEGALLQGAHLEGAYLGRATLTNVRLHRASITPRTELDDIGFGEDHDPQLDGATSIVFARQRDRVLNWAKLREIGTLPLFGVSYLALLLSVLTINGIGFLNETRPFETLVREQVGITYPLALPGRSIEILIASILLAMGTTLFKGFCPKMVQQYTEEQWLYELRHSVLFYRSAMIQRWWAQVGTLVFTTVGGILGGAILVERIAAAFAYILGA